MKNKSDHILSKYLPYFGSFIIFLGVTRLIFYYSSFNINIVQFLDFSEIITSFFDILTFVIIQFVFTTIQNFIVKSKSEIDEKNIIKQEILLQEKFFNRLKKYFKFYDTILYQVLIIFVGFLIVPFFNIKFHFVDAFYYLAFSFCLVIFLIIIAEIDFKHTHFNSTEEYKRYIGFLLNAMIVTGTLIFMTFGEVKSVKDNKKYLGVSFVLDDDTKIKSDSTNYFIGKTQNFVFFYHEKSNITDVIPTNRIKSMSFTKNYNR